MKNNKVEMAHMHKTRKTKALVPLERALYLLHPDNASLITCNGRNEEINVMAVAWIIPVSVNPPTAGYDYHDNLHNQKNEMRSYRQIEHGLLPYSTSIPSQDKYFS